MEIRENIYNRFIEAISDLRLTFNNVVNTYILSELSLKKETISKNKFALKLQDDNFLVQTAIITALMEAAKDKKDFEELHKNLKKKTPKKQSKELTDFDNILKGILKVKPKN